MSKRIHLHDSHQSTVILIEEDYIVIEVFYGGSPDVDLDHPDAIMIYEVPEAHWLATALTQAGLYLSGFAVDFYSCMRGECGESCPWGPGCHSGETAK